jgi:hypothetical protein
MLTIFNNLKAIKWKPFVAAMWPVVKDFKVAGLLFMNAFTLYAICWDTIVRPGLQDIGNIDKGLATEHQKIDQQKKFQADLQLLQNELKELKTSMLTVSSKGSSRLVAVQEAAKLKSLFEGGLPEERLLPELPQFVRQPRTVTINPGNMVDLDIQKLITKINAQPAPPAEGSVESTTEGNPTGNPSATPSHLILKEFEYQVDIHSTYANLLDIINELTLHTKLVKIKQLTIKPDQDNATWNAENKPIQLVMNLVLSVFVYEDTTKT